MAPAYLRDDREGFFILLLRFPCFSSFAEPFRFQDHVFYLCYQVGRGYEGSGIHFFFFELVFYQAVDGVHHKELNLSPFEHPRQGDNGFFVQETSNVVQVQESLIELTGLDIFLHPVIKTDQLAVGKLLFLPLLGNPLQLLARLELFRFQGLCLFSQLDLKFFFSFFGFFQDLLPFHIGNDEVAAVFLPEGLQVVFAPDSLLFRLLPECFQLLVVFGGFFRFKLSHDPADFLFGDAPLSEPGSLHLQLGVKDLQQLQLPLLNSGLHIGLQVFPFPVYRLQAGLYQ